MLFSRLFSMYHLHTNQETNAYEFTGACLYEQNRMLAMLTWSVDARTHVTYLLQKLQFCRLHEILF